MPHTIGTLGQQQNPAAEIEALGPVGWWRLNETSGSTVVAKVGTDGSYLNSPTLDSGPLAIDGSSFTADQSGNKHIHIPAQSDDINGSHTAFTISVFFKGSDLTPSSTKFQNLWENGGGANGISLGFRGASNAGTLYGLAWSGHPGGLTNNTYVVSRIDYSTWEDDKTYHVAYGYDSAGPTTVMYVNGESVGTVQSNTGGTVGAGAGANAIGGVNGQTRNTVGIYFDDEAIFGGQIGDVAFFDYLLTQNQVRRIARQMMTT